jgi:hypothetical protein
MAQLAIGFEDKDLTVLVLLDALSSTCSMYCSSEPNLTE